MRLQRPRHLKRRQRRERVRAGTVDVCAADPRRRHSVAAGGGGAAARDDHPQFGVHHLDLRQLYADLPVVRLQDDLGAVQECRRLPAGDLRLHHLPAAVRAAMVEAASGSGRERPSRARAQDDDDLFLNEPPPPRPSKREKSRQAEPEFEKAS